MNDRGQSCTAWGLRIRSEIALPFRPAASSGPPDVTIRFGPVPDALVAPTARRGPWQSAPGTFLLAVDGVARYLVRSGREIVVEPAGGSEAAVRTYLAGSVIAACLQQRGVLTLHASAVAAGGGAVLFAGRSGAGKSTLLAALVGRGYPMLADDVTGVVLGAGGGPLALAAFPAVRLRADAVDELAGWGWAAGEGRRELDKHVVPVEPFHAAPLPVRAVFVLNPSGRDAIEIETVPPGIAFRVLRRHTYRRGQIRAVGPRPEHFRILNALAARVPVSRIRRPIDGRLPGALADAIEARLGPPPRAEGTARPAGPGGGPAPARSPAAGD